MQLTEKQKEYWSRNLRITAILLFIWFLVTYVMAYFAIPLAEINFFGWPLSFYMAAQGSLDHLRSDHRGTTPSTCASLTSSTAWTKETRNELPQ